MPTEAPTWEETDAAPTWDQTQEAPSWEDTRTAKTTEELSPRSAAERLGIPGAEKNRVGELIQGPSPEEMEKPAITFPESVKDWIGKVAVAAVGGPYANTVLPPRVPKEVGESLGGMIESATSPAGIASLPALAIAPEVVLPEMTIKGIQGGVEQIQSGKPVAGLTTILAVAAPLLVPAVQAGLRKTATESKPPALPREEPPPLPKVEPPPLVKNLEAADAPMTAEVTAKEIESARSEIKAATEEVDSVAEALKAEAEALQKEIENVTTASVDELAQSNPRNNVLPAELDSAVVRSVIPAISNNQIARRIVSSIPVDVMDNFMGAQNSTEAILRDPSVLSDRLATEHDSPVAMRILREAVAIMGAEPSFLSEVARGDVERLTTAFAEPELTPSPDRAALGSTSNRAEPPTLTDSQEGPTTTGAPSFAHESTLPKPSERVNKEVGSESSRPEVPAETGKTETVGEFTLRQDPDRRDAEIVSDKGTLTARAVTRENPDGTHSVVDMTVFVAPGILDPRAAPRQTVSLKEPVTGKTAAEARQKAYEQFTESLNSGTFKPETVDEAPATGEQPPAPLTEKAAVEAAKPEPKFEDTAAAPLDAETKLAQIVNESVERANDPNKVGITPFSNPKPADVVLGATDLKSLSPAAEKRWQESVKEKPSLLNRLNETAVNAWHSITRDYADLSPRDFAHPIDILRRLRSSRNASARRTVDVLRGITHDLGPKQYSVFNRVIVLEDLLKDVESGKYAKGNDLPSGHLNEVELRADLDKFRKIADATPQIKAALDRRNTFMHSLRDTLVDRGFLPESVKDDPRYFHHQVLLYMAARKSGSGKSFRDWFSGWQKERTGSSEAYNRQYVEAEAEIIADAFNKITMQDLQGEMKAAIDITDQLKALHGKDWRQHIPDTHKAWQPERGNVFYPVKTVAERVMDDYLNGLRNLLPDDFKDAIALGQKKAEWVIPKELASVLDNLAPRKDTWIEKLAGAGISGWKRYILVNPLRAMKYMVNNMSGDLDFLFAANPKIFKEFKQAAKDSYGFHRQGKSAVGDVKEAVDMGVMQSGWRASELPNVSNSEYFRWLTGEKPGLIDRYWEWIGKLNDAREDAGRLATYRFAVKEWEAGRPFYGASVPKDVIALPTNKLRAAKVARELLIDYGRETEFGEFMRKKAVPFYRWMHGNFARYIQLIRNVPVQEGSGGARLATLAAKQGVLKGANLMARATFGYMAINLWNNLMFPKEEAELSETSNQLHLILGRDDSGNIQTIRFQGALSDLLSWVGLEDLPQDVKDLTSGKASVKDKMDEAYEAGVSKAVNSASPFAKTGIEAMTGQSLYPNALKPRPIRDTAEHVAGLFSLKSVYQWVAGKPHKPLAKEIASLLTYTQDPGEAAYYATRHMASQWLDAHGKERVASNPSRRSNALYYYKQALRYGDEKLAAKFKAQYEAEGGKQEGLKQSIAKSSPLSALGKDSKAFLESLSPRERAIVERADEWFRKVYKP